MNKQSVRSLLELKYSLDSTDNTEDFIEDLDSISAESTLLDLKEFF
jgi:hypothetical protein